MAGKIDRLARAKTFRHALIIGFQVEQIHQVGVLQVQTLSHATNFDFVILLMQQLQCDLFAARTLREIHLAKPTAVNPALERTWHGPDVAQGIGFAPGATFT